MIGKGHFSTQQVYEDPEIIDGYVKRNVMSPDQIDLIEKFCAMVEGTKVLDLGCGPGRDAQALNQRGMNVTGLDLSNEMIKRAKALTYTDPQPIFVVGSMLDLETLFEANEFDGVWASASLLHLDKSDVPAVLQGIRKVTKSKAVVMISLKAGQGTKMVKEDKYGKEMERQFSFWEKDEFLKVTEANGFELMDYISKMRTIEQTTEWHTFFFKVIKEENTISVSKAKPNEVMDIKSLLSSTWVDTYQSLLPGDVIKTATTVWHDPKQLQSQIESDEFYFGVAKTEDGEIVGLVTIRKMDDGVLFMNRLYVDPNHQRQGIGSLLLDAVIDAHPKAKVIKLEVEVDNHKGYGFYKKQGFVETAKKELEVGGKKIPVVEMEKKI